MSDIQIIVEETQSTIVQVNEPTSVISPVNGVTALDQLADVSIPTPNNGDALIFENGVWVSRAFAATDISFEFIQASAAAIWSINHNLNKYPSVTIVDSAGDEVEGNVNHVSKTQLTITFSAAFSGKAFLN
jgi:hypothetical protein